MAEKKPATKAGRKTKTATEKKPKAAADTTSPAPKETTTAEQANPQVTLATVTAKNGVNVRTSPEKGDNVKRVLPYGAEVTIQAKTKDAAGTEWAQIAPKEFIMRRFLQIV